MIAIDVMGGDHAPKVVLEGSLAAAQKGASIVLFGPKVIIEEWLEHSAPHWRTLSVVVIDAPEVIAMDDEPVSAIRKKQESSLVKAVASVAAGQCSAVMSAGNSGALMAASTFIIGRKEGVERPAIAGFLPGVDGSTLMLDLGAITDCRPSHLHAFAHMGSDYLKSAHGILHPRVSLLSNGHEEGKGSVLVKETYSLLKADSALNFIGNIEPYDIFYNKTDLVVSDGFSGNILLKTLEGAIDFACSLLPAEQVAVIHARCAHKREGAALLLGVKKPVLVCHGNSDSDTIEKAILYAVNVSGRNVKIS